MKYSTFLYTSLFVLLLFFLSYYIFGFYYEGADGIVSNLFSGTYSKAPFNDFFYVAMVAYGDVLEKLYTNFPNSPWYDILSYSILWLSSTIIIYIFNLKLKEIGFSVKLRVLLTLFIFLLILLPNLISLNQTRASILISGSGLVLLNYVVSNKDVQKVFLNANYYIAVVVFIAGSLFRLEGGVAALFIYGLFVLFTSNQIVRTILLLIIPSTILFVILISFSLKGMNSDEFVHQVEPDIEYQISGRSNLVPLGNMVNGSDSAKYLMAKNWIVNDPDHISIEFLRSIIQGRIDKTQRWDYFRHSIPLFLKEHYPLNLLFMILTIIMFLKRNSLLNRFYKWRLLLFNFSIIMTLLSIAYFVKMEPRLWLPILGLSSLLGFYYIMSVFGDNPYVLLKNKTTYVTMFCLMFLQTLYINKISREFNHNKIKAESAITEINSNANFKNIILDLSVINSTYTAPFNKTKLNTNANIIVHNLGALSLSKQYRAYLENLCECHASDYSEFYEFLDKHKNETIIVAKKSGIKLTKNYLDKVYNLDYSFPLKAEQPGSDFSFSYYGVEFQDTLLTD